MADQHGYEAGGAEDYAYDPGYEAVYDEHGYDQYGYDGHGYDGHGYDANGYDVDGYDSNSQHYTQHEQHYDEHGNLYYDHGPDYHAEDHHHPADPSDEHQTPAAGTQQPQHRQQQQLQRQPEPEPETEPVRREEPREAPVAAATATVVVAERSREPRAPRQELVPATFARGAEPDYGKMQATLAAQEGMLNELLDQQREVEDNQTATWKSNREVHGNTFRELHTQVESQSAIIREVWQQQDQIMGLLGIQNQLAEQDRQIREFINYQMTFVQTMQAPLIAQVEAVHSLRHTQREMLVSVGVSEDMAEHIEDAIGPGSGGKDGLKLDEDLDGDVFKYLKDYHQFGGLTPYPAHSPDHDAKLLRKAMKGLGTNEQVLATVIGSRTRFQRQRVLEAYGTNYKRDLRKDIRSETSGDFKRLLLTLLLPEAEADAAYVRKAIQGVGTRDRALAEVICSRNSVQIGAMKRAYQEMYGRSMVGDVQSDTSGDYQRLLTTLLEGKRDESHKIDPRQAREDASALYAAGEGKKGTNEQVFIEILTQRNVYHLRYVFDLYAKLEDYDIEKTITRETSFSFKMCLVTLVRAIKSPPCMFAERLHKAMKGLGTNDTDLIRIMSSRSEDDLYDISVEYQKMYKVTLEHAVRKETSSNYRRTLMELFGEGAFNPEKDSRALRRAMRGFWTNRRVINKLLAKRTNKQRLAVVETYQRMYKRDLRKDLVKQLLGDHERLAITLLKEPRVFAAEEARRAVKGLGTDDASLIEIVCTRTPTQLRELKESYREIFNRDFSSDVKADTSMNYRRLLLALIDSERNEDPYIAEDEAMEVAGRLFTAGEDVVGTDEATFIEIMSRYSFGQLHDIFNCYAKLCDYDIEKSIARETSGDFKRALLAIVKVVREPQLYFAQQLYKTMKGPGTADKNLIRIMVQRSEVDLKDISTEFFKQYKTTLANMIKQDTSFNYQRLLLAILERARQRRSRVRRPTKPQPTLHDVPRNSMVPGQHGGLRGGVHQHHHGHGGGRRGDRYDDRRGGGRNDDRRGGDRYDDRRGGERYDDRRGSYRYDDRRGGDRYDDRRGGDRFDDRRGSERYDDRRGSDRYDDRRGGDRYDDRRGGDRYDDRRGGERYDDRRGSDRYDDRRDAPRGRKDSDTVSVVVRQS